MIKHSTSCEDFRKELDALLAEALDPERARAIQAHKDTCIECGEIYENARDLLSSFSALSSPMPRPYVIENLKRSIEAERQDASVDTLWNRLRARPVSRLVAATALGLLASLVSIFSFSQVALSLEGLSQTLLVCALFWACGYTGMFDISFRNMINLHGRKPFSIAHRGSKIAVPVLIALGFATFALLATTPFGGLRLFFSPLEGIGHPGAAQHFLYTNWFLIGTLIGVFSLFFGVNFGRVENGQSIFVNGILAGSLFVLMIVPGFAIICVPFTLGIFFTLTVGLVIGAFSGGILGFWSLKIWRVRLRQI